MSGLSDQKNEGGSARSHTFASFRRTVVDKGLSAVSRGKATGDDYSTDLRYEKSGRYGKGDDAFPSV
ncbi:hypothetical protein HPB47_007599 [Ixodes persulcatus]|uniref:Uncharacterized protein n=1 Tax=Ixodes persulcatus TaxID=34615 RepID=A0AC60P785_IXOPE|nr:hypothetical protein HPB47_007599 [Ixodes persulcatus]